ncbi:hypothetical protein Tco_0960045 [Tanacetum coccineum]
MVGHGHRGRNTTVTPVRERELRDIEVDDLRRQVQQLQEELQRLKTVDEERSRRSSQPTVGSSKDDEDQNPFFKYSSSDESMTNQIHNRGRRNQFREFDIKVDIPEFEGRVQPDEFLDWLHTVERVFNFKEVSDERKVKHDCFLKLYNLKQKELSMEDYTVEFDHLMIKCDVVEPEKQIIARYLGGLRANISNILELQPYWSYSDVYKLADNDVAWWVESGAIVHVCKDRCWFKTYESLNDGSILHMGNESTALVHGCGCVDLKFSTGKIFSLFNVLHVPNIRKNLVFSSVLNNYGYKDEVVCDVVPMDACHLLLGTLEM